MRFIKVGIYHAIEVYETEEKASYRYTICHSMHQHIVGARFVRSGHTGGTVGQEPISACARKLRTIAPAQ